MIQYVLIMVLGGPAVITASFNDKPACEAAGRTLKTEQEAAPYSYRVLYWRCVPTATSTPAPNPSVRF